MINIPILAPTQGTANFSSALSECLGPRRELDWSVNVKLLKQVRREFNFGASTIQRMAKMLGMA